MAYSKSGVAHIFVCLVVLESKISFLCLFVYVIGGFGLEIISQGLGGFEGLDIFCG
jgi:hypothetical protein